MRLGVKPGARGCCMCLQAPPRRSPTSTCPTPSSCTATLDPRQVAAQVTLFLRLHNYGLVVNQIFWGLWLFPIGILVMRSGFIPRWLGVPLFFAGAGYVLNSLGMLMLPPP